MSAYLLVQSSTVLATSVVFAVVILSSMTNACFIRNCPKGGKRSVESTILPSRECMKCGPGGLGQCVGPNICCSPNFGCHIGTRETEVCQLENQSATPCVVSGEVCGARDSGNCVADGVCCDSESCAANERCRIKDDSILQDKVTRTDILQLIKKLLRVRDYD